ncbi:MAG: polyhydroxyalkanoic acid system family protein [Nevskiales bacterium]
MKHLVRHKVSQEQARQAIETAINVYSRKFPQYNPQTRWPNKNHAQVTFKVKGMLLTANIRVLKDSLDMDMDVPFIFWPIKNQAMKFIEAELRKWLARAEAGELKKT